MELFQCPCCDYFTLPTRYDWDICPVCFWEDEYYDIDRLDQPSPANHDLTLRQGRENFRRLGACEPEMIPNVCRMEDRAQFRHEPRPST